MCYTIVMDCLSISVPHCSEKKSQRMYEQIFSTLKEKRPQLNPLSFTIDYEREVINATFTLGSVYGEKMHNLGLQAWYNDRPNANLVKSIQALAFDPELQVIESFREPLETRLITCLEIFLPILRQHGLQPCGNGKEKKTIV